MLRRSTNIDFDLPQSAVQNSILRQLSPEAFACLRGMLRPVELKRRQILQEPNRPMQSLYFIESGLVSLFARTTANGPTQVSVVGRQGFIGVPIVLGSRQSPLRATVDVPGSAFKVEASDIQSAMDDIAIRQSLMNYVHAKLIQLTQVVLCNAHHSIVERLSRCLLLAHDRLDSDVIPITHDLLAVMLGVRRAGITEALSRLDQEGALERMRGTIVIKRRDLLSRNSCECYRTISREYDRLLGAACKQQCDVPSPPNGVMSPREVDVGLNMPDHMSA